ncbi:MAG: flagellar brake protein [Gammaproteobacteria bacterium]|nr:flagellar brake protein [Gammaproteobacteria bacterium]MBU2059475.1 flagellar brake protein [Gammaproteobacteria bacterium]MBU2175894.1 flagellar brake protein [Gammaproteobacteria bacterium]MBU2246308.1 flagellar brake protein [Gammaproteobacteria bacterium]MBU2345403.1 flagellar brake protein [Gammaproteobacteria bacterium]
MQVAVSSEPHDNKEWLSHVKIGQRFDVELLDQRKSRCSCELVGYKAGKYVLFRLDDDSLPDRVFINGLAVVCRFLVEDSVGECFAFKSELLQLMRFPDKLVVISFPTVIQRRALRTERRNSIFIPASVRLNLEVVQHARSFSGHLVDVSSGGCRFLFEPSHQGSKVNLAPVVLHIQCEKIGIDQQIQGEVRNSRLDERGLSIGIQFRQSHLYLDKLMPA